MLQPSPLPILRQPVREAREAALCHAGQLIDVETRGAVGHYDVWDAPARELGRGVSAGARNAAVRELVITAAHDKLNQFIVRQGF